MKIVEERLNNGIKLVSTHLPDSNSFTLYVLVNTGSIHEKIPGLAHFVEHTVFKGTTKRPTAFSINSEVESVGGYINAATSQEFTEFYIKIPNEFYERAFDILSDILFNSLFDTVELEKEKDVVIEEINMYEDMPVRNVTDSYYAMVWKDNALGRAILGTPETVRQIKRDDIIDFMQANYTPGKIIISVAGDLEGKDILKTANTYFSGVKDTSAAYALPEALGSLDFYNKNKKLEVFDNNALSIRLERRKLKQNHFCLGFEALPSTDPGMYPLEVAGGVLAEGSSSYLWQKIREEMGASYYLNSVIDGFKKNGVWYIHAGVDEEKLYDVIGIIMESFKKVINKSFGEEDIRRTKEYLKGDFVMNLEGSEEIARYNAHELMEHGWIKTVGDEKELLDAVTREQMSEVISKITGGKVFFNILTKNADLNKLREVISR